LYTCDLFSFGLGFAIQRGGPAGTVTGGLQSLTGGKTLLTLFGKECGRVRIGGNASQRTTYGRWRHGDFLFDLVCFMDTPLRCDRLVASERWILAFTGVHHNGRDNLSRMVMVGRRVGFPTWKRTQVWAKGYCEVAGRIGRRARSRRITRVPVCLDHRPRIVKYNRDGSRQSDPRHDVRPYWTAASSWHSGGRIPYGQHAGPALLRQFAHWQDCVDTMLRGHRNDGFAILLLIGLSKAAG